MPIEDLNIIDTRFVEMPIRLTPMSELCKSFSFESLRMYPLNRNRF